jgi:hypothetical protein
MSEVWEKQDYETPKQYHYFSIYRDLGINRSLRKVLDKLPPKQRRNSTISNLGVYSGKNKWKQRVEAYDLYLDNIRRKENEQAILEMNKRHIEESLSLQDVIKNKLKQLSTDEIKTRDLADLLELAVRIERDARGVSKQSNNEVNTTVTVENKLQTIDEDTKKKMEEIYKDAKKNAPKPKNIRKMKVAESKEE